MTERQTRQGCTVTTTFETSDGVLIEHVTLECRGLDTLELVKPDREWNWEWNQ